MVALTNESTSGAAELFAVSIRDFGKGKIVGATTAGKGTMQRLYSMSDGSAVSLTVAVLVPGRSESFDGVGVVPDYERVLTAEEKSAYYDFTVKDDPQILRASEVAVSLAAGNTGEGPVSSSSSSNVTDSAAATGSSSSVASGS